MAFNPLAGFTNPWAAGGGSAALNTPAISNKPSMEALQTNIFDNDREVLDSTSSLVDIKVKNEKSFVLNGSDVYISELPKMPKLSLIVNTDKYKKVSCKINFFWERIYTTSSGLTITRRIEKLIPEISKVYEINTNQEIHSIFNWEDKIIGGRVTIEVFGTVTDNSLIGTHVFLLKVLTHH